MVIKFDGHIPSVNHIYGRTKSGNVFMKKAGIDFKHLLGHLAKAQRAKLLLGDVCLSFEWHCLKKGQGDLDNKFKVIQDGLNGIAYKDDKQIVELHARKIKNSTFNGVVIEIREAK